MSDKFHDILQNVFGYSEFRGIQEDIIKSISSGHDTLGLMPTGGGKSLTFQVPALATDGVCIVITPLIALMLDQVSHLKKLGIQAAAIYSGISYDDRLRLLENAVHGGIKLLYIAPERLSSHLFLTKLSQMKVSFVTVDEAHCISQWGYDFRPSYLEIALVRKVISDVPILALTATATPQVVDDIQKQLEFRERNVFKMSFRRKNIAYIVRKTENKMEEMVHILSSVDGSAIVYVRNRQRTKELATFLEKSGITSTFYHAGLDHYVKKQRQEQWQADRIRVIVATNAFGMGIDKPNVRLVIHFDMPDSIEAYFQEAGRAGRDGKKAYAVSLYNPNDASLLRHRISDNYPPKEYISDVYDHLAYFYQVGVDFGEGRSFQFDIDRFCATYKYFPTTVHSALQILDSAGYISYNLQPDTRSRIKFILSRDDLDRLHHLTPNTEKLVNIILRTYSGLFVDYVNIDESYLAALLDTNYDQIYNLLRVLHQMKVISFIPHRDMPAITYLRDRVDLGRVVLGKDAYDLRKEQFSQHVSDMINYLTDDEKCRSQHLLEYFGETHSAECMICDVCVQRRKSREQEQLIEDAKKEILTLLSDGKQHQITEIASIKFQSPIVDEALHQLIDECSVSVAKGKICISN